MCDDTTIDDFLLSNVITLFLKYAAEQDIACLFCNCIQGNEELKHFTNRYFNNSNLETRSFFVLILINGLFDNVIGEPLVFKLQDIIIKHFRAITACFYRYYLIVYEETKVHKKRVEYPTKKVKLDKPIMGLSEVELDVNKFLNARSLRDEEIEDIFHKIIYTYREKRFYYNICNDKINKIEFKFGDNKIIQSNITQYKIVNSDRNPYIINTKTGVKISLGRQIQLEPFKFKDFKSIPQANTYDYFCGTHERIVKALSYSPNICHWCNPVKNQTNEKVKCTNCKNLLEDLNELKKTSDNIETKKANFNKLISSVKLNDVQNLIELKMKRKKLLINFVESVQNDKNKIIVNRTKRLIEKVFGTDTDLQS